MCFVVWCVFLLCYPFHHPLIRWPKNCVFLHRGGWGGVPGFKATSVFFALAIILESIVIGPARHGETTVQGTNPCKLKNYVKRNISQNNHWLDSWSLRFLGVTCSVYIYLFDCVCVSSLVNVYLSIYFILINLHIYLSMCRLPCNLSTLSMLDVRGKGLHCI